MIKELMDKLHIQDSVDENSASKTDSPEKKEIPVPDVPKPQPEIKIKKPVIPSIPKPKVVNVQDSVNIGGKQMNDGIIIDLGDGISLNVPIKRRMTLYEFLKVAEKVKALEMLAEEERRGF